MIHEGQKVTYVGLADDGLQPGDTGRLLVIASAHAAHVQTATGVYLVPMEDLVEDRGRTAALAVDLLEDSLDYGGLATTAVREVYDTEGSAGVISVLASGGHLSGFAEIVEEALTLVASRIRTDPSFRSVVATLDEDEAEAVVRQASASLIREAFGEEE